MAEVVPADILENIFLRLAVEDITRCKSVCESWYCVISSSAFVNSHLKHNINSVGRIIMEDDYWKNPIQTSWTRHMVGSCNGLVCIFTSDFELCVLNPCTRQLKTLENVDDPGFDKRHRMPYLNGFGYDPSSDDYKVIVGKPWRKNICLTRFYLLSLKSNVWKVVRDFKIIKLPINSVGTLCNGALHWLISGKEYFHNRWVILSFHLSTEEFKEIPTPADHRCKVTHDTVLGIVEECLCIFDDDSRDHPKWVLKNYNDTQSWELLPHLPQWDKDIIAHSVRVLQLQSYYQAETFFHYNLSLSETRKYLGAPVFVQSLVSPWPHVNMRLSI